MRTSEIERIGLGFVNCYLVRVDGGFILIDTGMPNNREALETHLRNEGRAPGKLKLIILTHGDIDHSGNALYLKSRYDVPVAMHQGDAEMVETGQMRDSRSVTSIPRWIELPRLEEDRNHVRAWVRRGGVRQRG